MTCEGIAVAAAGAGERAANFRANPFTALFAHGNRRFVKTVPRLPNRLSVLSLSPKPGQAPLSLLEVVRNFTAIISFPSLSPSVRPSLVLVEDELLSLHSAPFTILFIGTHSATMALG